MTLEQLVEDVYEGPIQEDIEQQTFKCTGVLKVALQPNPNTLRRLNIGDLSLDVSNINARLTTKDKVKAWNRDQAHDWWCEQMEKEKSRVEEKLYENGVDTQVLRVREERWVRLDN